MKGAEQLEPRQSNKAIAAAVGLPDETRAALEVAGIGVWSWEVGSEHFTWSREMSQLFGMPPETSEAPSGAWFRGLLHPDDLSAVTERVQLALKEQSKFEVEFRLRLSNGEVRWFSSQGQLLPASAGRNQRLVGVCRDVTEKRAREDEYRRLAATVEMMREGVVWYDREARFVYANPMALRLFQRTQEQVVGKFVWDVLPIDKDDQFVQAYRRALAQNAPVVAQIHYPRWDLWYECQFDPRKSGVLVNFRDVSAQKRAELENLQFKRLVQETSALIGIADLDRNVRFINDAGLKLLDTTLEAVRGRPVGELYFAEDKEKLFAAQDEVMRTGQWIGELRVRHPGTGEAIWTRSNIFLIRDHDGAPVATATVTYDLTEDRRAEQARTRLIEELQRSEARFRRVLDSGIIGIALSHSDGRLSEANAKLLQIIGYTEEDLKAGVVRWDTLTPPEWRDVDLAASRELLEFGVTQRPWEKEFIRKDGSRIAIESGAALLGPDEAVSYAVDITERKQREREIQTLVQVLEESPDFINVADAEGRQRFINEAGRRLIGLEKDEPVPESYEAFVAPEDRALLEEALAALRRGERWQGEMRLRHLKTGELIPTWRNIFPLRARGSGEIFARASVTRDLRAQKRLEQARERLIAMVGHDLRSPVSAIRISAEMLTRHPHQIDSVAQAGLLIQRSADRMGRMISQLLDFTRARLGAGLRMQPTKTDLATLCHDVLQEFRVSHPQRRFVLDQQGDTNGHWDPDRLAEVLTNLVGNAVQYGLPESPVKLTLARAGDDVTLEVTNQGPPIPPHLLPYIFDPFRRGHGNEKSSGSSSLGLGLYITREIVLAHGGDIRVQSRAGEGTTFHLRLPREPPATQEAATEKP